MIEVTAKDIGRRVAYNRGKYNQEFREITSFNDSFIFVKYDSRTQSQATGRRDLEWE